MPGAPEPGQARAFLHTDRMLLPLAVLAALVVTTLTAVALAVEATARVLGVLVVLQVLLVSVAWSRANRSMEGEVLIGLTDSAGLTVADLAVPVAWAVVGGAWLVSRSKRT